jgi:hypothetical protein
VPRAERVVRTLLAAEKPAEAVVLAQRGEPLAAAGEDLVRVGLVPDVPDEAVARRVEDIVQRDVEVDRAERAREVISGPG